MVSTDAIVAMKSMAADPKKREMLVKDTTCMGGLVLVLSNPDPSVVTLALETLLLLSEDKDLRPAVVAHIGILDQLEALLHRSQCEENVRVLADQLYGLLTESSPLSQVPLKASSNNQNYRISVKGKGSNRSTKSVVLQIRGVHDQADRDLCMRLLLRVKGVVSITFDISKKQCLLRTKSDVKPESLVRAIAKSMTMTAQQVIRNENGEETLVAFNMSGGQFSETAVQEKENDSVLPPYLSDDEDDKHSHREEDKSALSKGGAGESATAKWFSAAANFFTNSFYW